MGSRLGAPLLDEKSGAPGGSCWSARFPGNAIRVSTRVCSTDARSRVWSAWSVRSSSARETPAGGVLVQNGSPRQCLSEIVRIACPEQRQGRPIRASPLNLADPFPPSSQNSVELSSCTFGGFAPFRCHRMRSSRQRCNSCSTSTTDVGLLAFADAQPHSVVSCRVDTEPTGKPTNAFR